MHVITVHDPFHPLRGREVVEYRRRRRISTLTPKTNRPFICLLNGEAILRKEWKQTVSGDDVVVFVILPQGGGGSNPLRLILMIAVTMFAPQVGALAFETATAGMGLSSAAISMGSSIAQVAAGLVGMSLVNALVPPPKPPAMTSNSSSPSPTYNLQAQGNSARLEQAIPVQYGRLRVFPDFASTPYVEYANNEQYLYQLFCLGQGWYEVEDIRIEDTSIDNFLEVQYEVLPPSAKPTLFPSNVVQTQEVSGQDLECLSGTYSLSGTTVTVTITEHGFPTGQVVYLDFSSGSATDGTFTITNVPDVNTFTVVHGTSGTTSGNVTASSWVGPFVANPVETNCTSLGFDLICPKGLYYAKDDGSLSSKDVLVTLQARLLDQQGNPLGNWTNLIPDDQYTDWTEWGYASTPSVKQGSVSQSGTTMRVVRSSHGYSVGQRVFIRITSGYYVDGFYTVQTSECATWVVDSVLDANTFTCVNAVVQSYSGLTCYMFAVPADTMTEEYQGVYNPAYYDYTSGDGYYVNENYAIQRRTRTLVTSDAVKISGATTTPIRQSFTYSVKAMGGGQTYARFEVQARRTNARDTNNRAGHDVVWGGLRAYMPENTDFGNVTLIAVKARASNNLSSQTSRKINTIATRKLQAVTATGLSIARTATRSMAAAIADACLNTEYGAGLPASAIDFAQLYALDQTLSAREDYFDGRFDSTITFWDALNQIAASCRSKVFLQGGVVHTVRDQPVSVPVAMFSMRNIIKNSFSVQYLTPSQDTADSVEIAYLDESNWKPQRVMATLKDSTSNKPAKVDLFGVVNRDHAHREGLYRAAANRYRRKIIKFSTEAEGFIPSYGDLITITHDMPQWGQGAEVVGWDVATRTLTVSEPMTWKSGQTHYVGLRKRDGSVGGPYTVTATTDPRKFVLSTVPDFDLYYWGTEERTHVTFGWGETWRQPARVISVQPRGLYNVEITAVNEDASVHTADQGITAPAVPYSQLPTILALPAVKNLKVSIEGTAQGPIYKASWDAAPGAEKYVIEQSNDGGTTWFKLSTAYDNLYYWPAATRTVFKIRVAAIGLAKGDWSVKDVDFTGLPPNVTGVTVASNGKDIVVKWNKVNAADLFDYEVREGSSWGTATSLAFIKGTTAIIEPFILGSHTVLVKARDALDYYSDTAGSGTIIVVAPSVVSGITVKFSGENAVVSWSTVSGTYNIGQYEVRYINGTWGGSNDAGWASGISIGTFNGTSAQFKATGSTTTVFVRATDIHGNTGAVGKAQGTVVLQTAPTVSGSFVAGKYQLTWTKPTPAANQLSLVEYEIRYGGLSFAQGTYLTRIQGTSYRTHADWGLTTSEYGNLGERLFWVAAVDSGGNTGAAGLHVATITPPDAPVITPSFNLDQFTPSWTTPPSDLPIAEYEIRYGSTWASSTLLMKSNATSISVKANWSDSRTWWVAAIDINGYKGSPGSVSVTINAPSAPSITQQVVDNNVLLYWSGASGTLPIATYEIRRGATWAGGTLVGEKSGGFTTIFETVAGTFTYWVMAIDTAGNTGTPSSVTVTVNQPPDYVLKANNDLTLTSGTFSNATTYQGELFLGVNTTETWTTHFTSSSWSGPQSQVTAGYPYFIQPGTGTGYYEETLDYGIALAATKIAVTLNASVLVGTPTVVVTISVKLNSGDAWTDYPGTSEVFVTNFRYAKIRVAASGTGVIYKITKVNVRLDAKLKGDSDTTACVSSDASGTIANFTVDFLDVTSINLSPAGTGSVTAVYDFLDSVLSGTYSVSSNVATVSVTGHGLITGQKVKLMMGSGTAPSGIYTVTSYTSNSFTVAMTTANTSGTLISYPQGFRIYLFNSTTGARVSGTASWSVKGY